ncbi:unnamed protein product [Rotaria magnacalcarata]|uniref:NAD(P)(+)--arginine ADP-ribosyltransferase n=1 Tax=Rotaria magnacalcarata TaxID=392030 RepID=A0A819D753_9BILA|nr:unnamed protein product [Rotaria magnacalcarata]
MWQSNPNPWSKSEPVEWSHYSDVENLIIEEVLANKQPKCMLDGYYADANKQRPVKRVVRNREDNHLRQERFMFDPIAPLHSLGSTYGWVSPFIVEVRIDLGLRREQLPSKNTDLILMLVEKAAQGIIEEGRQIGKAYEAEKLANMLRVQQYKGIEVVWKCCAYLYSLESFLYKKLNEIMRFIGSEGYEHVWRSKVRTLGPFYLLLWDDPINKQMKTNMKLYRGVNLTDEQLATYERMAKFPGICHSFQAFTWCSRNRKKAEEFGDTLFIMEVLFAFTADLSALSQYPNEEEELITPGICFSVQRIEFEKKTNKRLIYMKLRQRFSGKYG